jgi:hypothetical protein
MQELNLGPIVHALFESSGPCSGATTRSKRDVRSAQQAWKQKKSENNISKNIFLDCYHSNHYEVFCLLGYNAINFVESKLTFRSNM